MQTMAIDKFNELGTRAYETAKQIGEMNARVGSKLVDKQVEIMDFYVKFGIEQMQRVGAAKSYQDVLAANTEFNKGLTEKLITEARAAADLTAEVRADLVELFKTGAAAVEVKPVK